MNEIELKKLKEDYPDFFENFPKEIAEVILAEETPLKISEICIKNGLKEEEKIEKIAYQITLVLLGQLPPKELQKTLEKELGLELALAQKIYIEADQSIFSTIKESLATIYEEEITPVTNSSAVSVKTPKVVVSKKTKTRLKEKAEEKPSRSSKAETTPDTYREPTG
jgi:hypothetical protein